MTNTEFLEELKILIMSVRENLITLKEDDDSIICQAFVKKQEAMLDKLEQDYFHQPTINVDIVLNDIKKFDEDGNLINEGEKEISITEQIKEGLLKLFNKYVLDAENNVGMYEFDYDKYSIALCQIADRLLQIESDREMINCLGGV